MRKSSMLLLTFLLINPGIQASVVTPTKLNNVDIIGNLSLDPSCLNYCITGICVWLRCSVYECSIETSLKVSHFNPDFVVSVFDEGGDNPWTEAQSMYGSIEQSVSRSLTGTFHDAEAGGGHQTEGGHAGIDQSLRFKEATVIGHPLSSFSSYLGNGYYCPSEADSLFPYFSSSFDTLSWRSGLPDMLTLQNLLPGRRVIGSGLQQQWGPLWPRTGFIKQKDDAKAAAVIAQRAGNIVTQSRQPHVYSAPDGNDYHKSWLPDELAENAPATGVWQMLAPKADTTCYAFGENDVFGTSWSSGRQSEDNRYAFALWRPYECCEGKGLYLTTIPFRVCL